LAQVAASCFTPQNDAAALSSLAGRLQPVPTGSTNTRSVKGSQLSGLSTSLALTPSVSCSGNCSTTGPAAPSWRKAEPAPGPPLKKKLTGRVLASVPASV
jgi:hypothetical protein